MPLFRDAFELVLPSIVELDVGPRHEVFDRARDQYLGGPGKVADTLADVHRDAADVIASNLDFARMQADPHLEMYGRGRIADRARTTDRACRSVERGEETIPDHLHFAATESCQLMTDGGIVCIEELCPPAITERRGQFGGAHHISEHDGRENAVGLGWYANAGEELPNLLDDGIGVASPRKVVLTWKIDVAGVWDLFGHPTSRPPIDHTVPVSVEHQRRHAQGRQHATYIDVEEHAKERSQAIGADAGAAVTAQPLLGSGIIGEGGSPDLHVITGVQRRYEELGR